MAINCDWLQLTRRFLLRSIYIFHTRVTFLPCETQSAILSIPVALLSIHLIPNLCAHRDRESRPRQSGFWGASSATARWRDRLLPLRRISGSSSSWWTFVGLHCEHLPAPTEVHYFSDSLMAIIHQRRGRFLWYLFTSCLFDNNSSVTILGCLSWSSHSLRWIWRQLF